VDRSERLKTAQQLVELASRQTQQGDLGGARRRLDEAGVLLGSMGGSPDADQLALTAAVHEGKGQLALNAGHLDEAYFELSEALQVLEREGEGRGKVRELSLAVAHMNLSSVCSRLGRVTEALDESDKALAAIDRFGYSSEASVLRLAALQGRAMLHAAAGTHEAAWACFEEALVYGSELVVQGVTMAQELLTQVRLTLAELRADQGDHGIAQEVATEAAEEAWDRVEEGDERALPQYLNAQFKLVGICHACGDFARAEDALFRVLKLIGPQPEVLSRGRVFYQELLTLDDATLEAGNLPRDEVEESLADIERMIDEASQA